MTLLKEQKTGQKNLLYLAKQLAINYYNTSLPRDFDNDTVRTDSEGKIKQSVFYTSNQIGDTTQNKPLHAVSGIRAEYADIEDKEQEKDERSFFEELGTHETWVKNIVVLGAGGTYDSFPGIPLGNEAVKKIYQSIEVAYMGTIPESTDEKKDTDKTITFYELIHSYNSATEKFENSTDDKQSQSYIHSSKIDYLNYNNGLKLLAQKYHRELERLRLHNPEGLNEKGNPDFETSLFLLTKFFPITIIRERIQDLYDYKYGPTLFYDILAHLFKHRMVDVIVNFNFDELLDQAISDELGETSFHKVVSDGDCKPFEDFMTNNKLRQPIYIKPHGTASHKSTLKYTKDHYYDLPKDMSKLLLDLISKRQVINEATDNNDEKQGDNKERLYSEKVNLIIFGFNMASIEFNDILNKHLPTGSKIFYFFHVKNDSDAEKKVKDVQKMFSNIFKGVEKSRVPELYLIGTNIYDYKYPSGEYSLNNISNELWNNICCFFQEEFKPSNISRHQIIHALFGNEKLLSYNNTSPEKYHSTYFKHENSCNYLLDRAVVELLITIFRGRGYINPKDAIKEKSGIYYSLYDQTKASSNTNNKSSFAYSDILKATRPREVMYESIFEPMEYSLEVGDIELDGESTNRDFGTYFMNKIDLLQKEEGLISDSFSAYIKDRRKDEQFIQDLGANFKRIYKSNRSNIRPNFSDPRYTIFKQFSGEYILHTSLAMDLYYYRMALGNNGNDTLLMIAEAGRNFKRFRKDFLEKGRYKNIYIIVADYDLNKEDTSYDERLSATHKEIFGEMMPSEKQSYKNQHKQVLLLPPEDHSHHMGLFLNGKKLIEGADTGKGIYYYQSNYSNFINPVEMNEASNIRSLLSQFNNYYLNAIKIAKAKGTQYLSFKDEELPQTIKDILMRSTSKK